MMARIIFTIALVTAAWSARPHSPATTVQADEVSATDVSAEVGAENVAAKERRFQKTILPILQLRCVRCHGPEKHEADIRLDNLSIDLIGNRAAAENWHEVRNVLNSGEMPPPDEPPLSADERKLLHGWVNGAIEAAIEARQRTDGRTVQRRLNRIEYQNTMFDLLGVEMDYARDLPPDPVSQDGFRNDGRALQMSSLQLEYYLQTARRALGRVLVSGAAPQVFEATFTESNVRNWRNNVERSNVLGRQQVFLGTMVEDYPEEGEFRVRVTLTAGLKPAVGFPILELSVGYRPDTQILFRVVDSVEIQSPDEQTIEFRGRIENHPLPVRGQGKFPGLVVRIRNLYDDGSPLPKGKKGKFPEEPHLPVIRIKAVEFRGPVFESWPPEHHRRILCAPELRDTDESACVAEVLKRFLPRAFRRPVEDSEVDRFVDFFQSIRADSPTFEEAVRETLALVLISPDFLYLVEPGGNEKRPVSDFELASRLSYFLWSSMPDDELMECAAAGELRHPDVLARQAERLLQAPQASRFVRQFTRDWLQLDVVDRVAVSRDHYAEFRDELKQDMVGETEAFFAELLRENLSALNLLQSDFTMLNERLARHYGIEGVLGSEFRRVTLPPDQHRGGVLGQASILLANSTGSDSHAVRRAVWIRDRLLNDPPAPPPPDVPSLEEADPKFLKLSVREQLEFHRGTEACASCHRSIDPWGIALENFDAVGLWRDEIRRRKKGKTFETLPVDASDTLPNGRTINGADDLRGYLASERKNDFARSLVRRLLTYALSRRLELSDSRAIDDLHKVFADNDYRLRDLVKAIVASEAFQTK